TLRRDHAEGFERLMRATGQAPEESGFLGGAWETLGSAWEQAGGMVEGAGEQLQSWGESLQRAAAPWWAEEIGEEVEEKQGHEHDEDAYCLEPEQNARLDAHRVALAEGKTDVLTRALTLKDTSAVGHVDDIGRNQSNGEIWDGLKEGKIDHLTAIKCSEFTSAAVAAAGYDLDQQWLDPASGMRVAYQDGGSYTFVKLWMVVGTLLEATHALLVVQNGDAEEIDPSSARAAELGLSGESERFLYVSSGNFVGMEASEEQMFGLGAAAVGLGGSEVELNDRKPGDVQQSLRTNSSGKYSGSGHSSVVHAVRGTGVAKLGVDGCPKVEGDVQGPAPLAELEAGWYRINKDSGLKWVVGPGTIAATVAQLDAVEIQLVDANTKGSSLAGPGKRGGDATAIGAFQEHRGFNDEKKSATTSAGRLPSSPWHAWSPREEEAEELSAQAPKSQSAAAPSTPSPSTRE
ncbi:MAG: hypothetical protein EA397_17570, partial [Deltaproteobacteria bacterium]